MRPELEEIKRNLMADLDTTQDISDEELYERIAGIVMNAESGRNHSVKERIRITEDRLRRLVGKGDCSDLILPIENFPFTVGKKKGAADGVINRPTISRIHAKLYQDKNSQEYYLEDENSSNGTTVNGVPAPAYTHVPVHVGDLLQFADASFVFQ